MQPDLVGIQRVPSEIEPLRPLLPRADAVLPPVTGHKIATRIANGRYAEFAYEIHHVGPETVRGGRGMPGLIDPVVNAPAKMLDEGAKHTAVQRPDGVGRIHDDPRCRHEVNLSVSASWAALWTHEQPALRPIQLGWRLNLARRSDH